MKLRPILVLAAIAALMIAFIYWREHAVTVKKTPGKYAPARMAPAKPAKTARKRPAAPAITMPAATAPAAGVAPIAKKRKGPVVAIVIDDFGYTLSNLDGFFDIDEPITLSVLPNERYTGEVVSRARARGYEVILHLPLESWRNDVKEEALTIRSGMGVADIDARMKKELADVPGVHGVSNHMGSKATEDRKVMSDVLRCLKSKDLYFFDSLTSPRSVCREVASELGVKYARRDRFLDNDNSVEAIEKQLSDLQKLAFARGEAIAICHDRKNTVVALAKMMPEMARSGIEFVYLSEMAQ
jgi:uncharacterized protein